ncbi:hypothetical protein GUITHDRAFT_137732 [Guillardia theta CCMP2712]|uniref:Uncharacterized protein n=1 Tax=Guillardia theta (strain CCMP2712) TaxID=905079 RepID=L1JGA1_GUITC|nr:hypothetical protein GUITHDRAFT_137732 [Guillardia theta CCMP2712]EKX47125.1 hypothetical protein GUITHDRAFT_137732 [Guillardia theta CCMP2712]|eukprot:XP_005834105.1 hypothetical protein GUITHDRAFT_137732 [Guillardia theta CCMP2712]
MAESYQDREGGAKGEEPWWSDPRNGHSIIDDLYRWMPNLTLRIDRFPPHCLTISGAVSLAVGVIFLLGAFMNVVEPHYDKIAHSVQTRCEVMSVTHENLVEDKLFHYILKFPLPGIPGLQDGEAFCYGSQKCSVYEVGSVHVCYFNTEDHTVRFYTALSGHSTIRVLSYVILTIPFLIGAFCCLVPASLHWNSQLRELKDSMEQNNPFKGISNPFASKKDEDEYYSSNDAEGYYQRQDEMYQYSDVNRNNKVCLRSW